MYSNCHNNCHIRRCGIYSPDDKDLCIPEISYFCIFSGSIQGTGSSFVKVEEIILGLWMREDTKKRKSVQSRQSADDEDKCFSCEASSPNHLRSLSTLQILQNAIFLKCCDQKSDFWRF